MVLVIEQDTDPRAAEWMAHVCARTLPLMMTRHAEALATDTLARIRSMVTASGSPVRQRPIRRLTTFNFKCRKAPLVVDHQLKSGHPITARDGRHCLER